MCLICNLTVYIFSYLVALSLEQEQQLSQEQLGWGQIDPQQAPEMSE